MSSNGIFARFTAKMGRLLRNAFSKVCRSSRSRFPTYLSVTDGVNDRRHCVARFENEARTLVIVNFVSSGERSFNLADPGDDSYRKTRGSGEGDAPEATCRETKVTYSRKLRPVVQAETGECDLVGRIAEERMDSSAMVKSQSRRAGLRCESFGDRHLSAERTTTEYSSLIRLVSRLTPTWFDACHVL